MEARKIDQMRGRGTGGDLNDAIVDFGGQQIADDAYSAIFGAPLRMMRDGVGYGDAFKREQLLANAQKRNREERSPTANMVAV